MSKAEEIQSIINQRKPLAVTLGKIESELQYLNVSIQELERECQQQQEYWSDNHATVSRLKQLNFADFRKKVRNELESLQTIKSRFDRPTLNIGVIGRMGQGKSTLLQSLSGLKNEVIPAMRGKACTAARSTICHQEGNLTKAKIEFHSETSFLKEIIAPYYEKLKLGSPPSSFNDFADHELPSLSSSADQTARNIYNRLRDDYYKNAEKYKNYLNKHEIELEEQEKISNFVAQKHDHNYQLLNHQCLAVKQVEIFCPFPISEMGAIALVDVPGLGDFRLGDERLVIEALGQEVDFILFIRKPPKERANFEQNDTELYKLANQALNDLPSRSIFVLNVDQNRDNIESCRSLKKDIDDNKVEIPVLDCVIADCSSQQEANQEVLQKVLDNLRSNVTKLDHNYTKQKVHNLESTISDLREELLSAQHILPDIDRDEIDNNYDDFFEDFWGRFANNLQELQNQLIQNRESEDENLKQEIERVFKDIEITNNLAMPNLRDIEYKGNISESYSSTYDKYKTQLRTDLSRRFLDIEKGLQKTINEIKDQVAQVLVEQCGLEGLTEERGVEFLQYLYQQIPSEYTELKKGFEILVEFNLSYRGLIQHRIRKNLDQLTPKTSPPLQAGANAENVLESLQVLYEETIYKCNNALNDFLNEPSQASFAIVEEFADRVVRATTAKPEWRKLLRRNKSKIWQDFDKLQSQANAAQKWSYLLNDVMTKVETLDDSLKKI